MSGEVDPGVGRLPDFLGLGAERAATTWLHNCLAQHPDVFVPPGKEVHYYSTHRERSLGWYTKHFAEAPAGIMAGEISPSYLHDADPAAVRDALPNARLIVILRQPMARTRSAFELYYREKPEVTLSQALRESTHLVTRSLYADALTRWQNTFGVERVGVWLHDDVSQDPIGTFAAVCRFLGVDDEVVPEATGETFNRVLFPRLQKHFYDVRLGWVVSLISSSAIGAIIKRTARQRAATASDPASGAVWEELAERFLADIDRLESTINRDLSAWRATCGG
ncbi:sulfotransferase family protein [Alienimonas californiensis]|uniref:Sulfotransferase domain protein n=1 Tax=Alienimonas californiensis TaxID=2527989 RepID=A0A517P498_9PLAN|nr:sulfotransferase [Alienimonas californiensis]QDT14173.1 hypothetical protein CA12_02410 [Alienimonas californiensis]